MSDISRILAAAIRLRGYNRQTIATELADFGLGRATRDDEVSEEIGEQRSIH